MDCSRAGCARALLPCMHSGFFGVEFMIIFVFYFVFFDFLVGLCLFPHEHGTTVPFSSYLEKKIA